jgi:hypothetical protein
MLEYKSNDFTYFVTYTYNNEHLPEDESLVPEHIQLYWKRFRKNRGIKIRYFVVGEYGDKSGRPHYHAIIYSNQDIPLDLFSLDWRDSKGSEIGFVYAVPIFNRKDASKIFAYVAGYVLKKLTTQKAMSRIGDKRHPEFFRSSRRPAIGHTYIHRITQSFKKYGINPESKLHMIRLESKLYPVNKYLRKKIIEHSGGAQHSLLKALTLHNKVTAVWRDPDAQIRQDIQVEQSYYKAFRYFKLDKTKRKL